MFLAAMSVDEILGWVTVVLDTYGARTAIQVILLLIVAGWAYNKFINKD